MNEGQRRIVEDLKEQIRDRLADQPAPAWAAMLEELGEWVDVEAAVAATSDPDRLQRTAEGGARGLKEPE